MTRAFQARHPDDFPGRYLLKQEIVASLGDGQFGIFKHIAHEIRRASRVLTLKFVITGKSTAEFSKNKQRFMEELDKGVVEIQVPALGGQVYNLIYRGQSIQYGRSRSRKTATLSARFEEPNPTDRV